MSPAIATLVCAIGVVGLFALDPDSRAQTSRALWMPIIWLLINGSRPVSMWLGATPSSSTPQANLEGSPLDAAIYGCLLTVGLIVLISRGRRVGTLLWANGPLSLFFSYC